MKFYRTNPNRIDTDGDSLTDLQEIVIYPTSPKDFDTDVDGLEINTHNTDPLDPDKDSIFDGYEADFGLNPLNASDAHLDYDFDGLTNFEEFGYNTNPFMDDSDAK